MAVDQPGQDSQRKTPAIGERRTLRRSDSRNGRARAPKWLKNTWRRLLTGVGLQPRLTPHRRLAQLLDQPSKRTPQEWKTWRKATVERVKQLLASNKGVVAARELSRAMLQDPEFPVFQELMQEAISLKLKRDAKAGKPDPWADLPKDLRAQALQLEGFQLYVEEVEQMLNKAGFPQLSAPKTKAK